MATTPHIGLVLLEQAQAQKELTVNTALMRIDALLNAPVIDKDLTTPPASPATGDTYIVPAGATGAWAGQSTKIAYFEQVWRFITPNTGLMRWIADESAHYIYNGSIWSSMALGAGVLDDLTNVALSAPADGQVLTYDSATHCWVNETPTGGGGSAYTNEDAQDAIGSILTDSATIDFTYNDGANTITAIVKDTSITTTKLGGDITAAGKALLDDASAAAQRTTLGLGSAATQNTGTSGGTIPLLNGANSWSAAQAFASGLTLPNSNQSGDVTLDWYEKGSFTPVVTGGTSAGTGTYTEQYGRYIRIGRLVQFNVVIRWTAHSGTGNLTIAGLPWSVSNYLPFSCLWSQLTLTSGFTAVALTDNGASSFSLYGCAVGAAANNYVVQMDSAASLYLSGSFII